MIQTVHRMGEVGDETALQELWSLLGGVGTLVDSGRSATEQAETVAHLIQQSCFGKGDVYTAERKALVDLAEPFKVEPARFATSDALEDAIVDALIERVRERIEGMSESERQEFVEDMLKRMSDEDRMQLVDALLRAFDELPDDEQERLVRGLVRELGLEPDVVRQAIAGGSAVLIPLMLARGSGFTVYLLSTRLMASFFGVWGVVVPFAVYQQKNVLLRSLLGPVGMVVTTALSAGWFAAGAWRRMTRFKKLVQIGTYTSGWRRRHGGDN